MTYFLFEPEPVTHNSAVEDLAAHERVEELLTVRHTLAEEKAAVRAELGLRS